MTSSSPLCEQGEEPVINESKVDLSVTLPEAQITLGELQATPHTDSSISPLVETKQEQDRENNLEKVPSTTNVQGDKPYSGVTTPIQGRKPSKRKHGSEYRDPIIAPGFGTAKDIRRLAEQLSVGNSVVLPPEAVLAMMKARGQGLGSSRRNRSSNAGNDGDQAAPPPSSSAWADFMKEEGVISSSKDSVAPALAESRKRPHDSSVDEEQLKAIKTKSDPEDEDYQAEEDENDEKLYGVLVQAGTLDVACTGRSKVKLENPPAYNLLVPTKLLPTTVKVKSIHTSSNSCHSIAITTTGTVYGWGRNEYNQISFTLPSDVIVPTILDGLPGGKGNAVVSAATGKSHTLLLLEDGTVHSIGLNKSGQCGIKLNQEKVTQYKKCIFQDRSDNEAAEARIKQIACGEDFSMAVSVEGYLFSAGSAEFGQLGNGETGEHIVQAGKSSFANSNAFIRRSTFCYAPNEKLYTMGGNQKEKVVPIDNELILIDKVACGKHHSIALEKKSDVIDAVRRVFSWGCGAYGCLGHGVQVDEYFPRLVGSLVSTVKASTAAAKLAKKSNLSFISVSAGAHCSLLQLPTGHVYYWGRHRAIGEATMRPQLVDALANNSHVVRHVDAGNQSVILSTANAVTVAWGQGLYGELGLGQAKSSAKPTFVSSLDGCRVVSLVCGYGHTLYIIRNDDDEDQNAVKNLPSLNHDDCQPLMDLASTKAKNK